MRKYSASLNLKTFTVKTIFFIALSVIVFSCGQNKGTATHNKIEDVVIAKYVNQQSGSAKIEYVPESTLLIDSIKRKDILAAWLSTRNHEKNIDQHTALLTDIIENQEKLMKMTGRFSDTYPDELYSLFKVGFAQTNPDSLCYTVVKKNYTVTTPDQKTSPSYKTEVFFIVSDSVILNLPETEIALTNDRNGRVNAYEKIVKDKSLIHGRDFNALINERMLAQLPKQ